MEDKVKNLEHSFAYIKTFYRELAQMISDADDLMGKKGWEVFGDSGVTYGTSKSLNSSDRWNPSLAFRFYHTPNDDKCERGFIVSYDKNEWFPIGIICGVVREEPKITDRNSLWYLITENKKLDSPSESIQLTSHRGRNLDGKVSIMSLTGIQNKKDLNQMIERLIGLE